MYIWFVPLLLEKVSITLGNCNAVKVSDTTFFSFKGNVKSQSEEVEEK